MTCPQEPVPAGWKVWQGPVPPELTQVAIDYRDHINDYQYGQIIGTVDYNGAQVGVFKSHHVWTYVKGKGLVTGLCIPGVSLIIPTGTSATPQDLTVPDPNLAMWGAQDLEAILQPPSSTDWGIVAVSGAAIAAVIAAFWAALKFGGRAAR